MDKERINKEAESFFEWPTPDKSTVSTVSMIIFCNVIAEMVRIEERERCKTVCKESKDTGSDRDVIMWNKALDYCLRRIGELK